jgi:hypothetical protein
MAGRKGQQQAADPAARTLKAAEECRAATREAHEAIQALAEMRTELRALITEAQQFTLAHVAEVVPAEVTRQLKIMEVATQAAMNASVEKVSAEFARLEALFLGKEDDGKPSLEELIVSKESDRKPSLAELITPAKEENRPRCPYCGFSGASHTPVGDDKTRLPQVSGRSVSICTNCSKPSMFASGPMPGDVILREPTDVEAAQLSKTTETQRGIRQVQRMLGGRQEMYTLSPPERP